jgi:phosphoglycerate dehydrogenase-like enzyme/glyoxylase-like metal-dependent hydrolase (beta-lactamase superfamily II)
MKSLRSTDHRRVLALFGLLVSTAGAATAGSPEATLPSGVNVQADGPSARNQVWIEVGGDLLAADSLQETSPGGVVPRYRIATAAPGPAAAPGSLLWPASRPRDEASDRSLVVFDSGFTIAAADREVVFLDLGRAATAADAALWLPAERVLITGGLCSPGRVEAGQDTDSGAWIAALERLRDLEPRLVVPGAGAPGGPELLDEQLDRLAALREHVEAGLLAGRGAADLAAGFTAPWFADWRRQDRDAADGALQSLFEELGGLRPPWELIEKRGLREGPSPGRGDEGWTPPRKVLWRNLWPERLPMLALVAPGVEIIPFDTAEEAMLRVAEADALIGTATPELLAAGEKLRWVQVGSAGVERYLAIPELGSGEVLLSNGQRLASPEIAEHVMALTRALARGLDHSLEAQSAGEWRRSEIRSSAPLTRLRGKTMLVVGLGGIGTEVARLAEAAGMRVTAIRSSWRSGPPFVARVGLSEDLLAFAAEADVVANCLPLTPETEDLFDAELFRAMRPTAFFINVGRGRTVDTEALTAALAAGEIAGAGLDVTDPEPLPPEHPLWKAPQLIVTPHYAARSDLGRNRHWLLYRENLRRFAAGEPLLSVVDPERGY